MPFETTESKSQAMIIFKSRLSKLETEHGRLQGLRIKPQPTDVFIVTPPKSGTTLCCQIVQSLRTGGSMDFEEINLEIPCLEMAYDSGLTDIDVPQQSGLPRVFKTHSWYPHCPKGAKYIYIVRNPLDVGPSFYNFMANWFFSPSEISMSEFLEDLFLARGAPQTEMQNASHWHNMASWYPHRLDENVLWLHYEDMIQNSAATVALIAEFIGKGHDDEQLQALAVEQSSIQHMKAHHTKYDEHHLKLARNEACGLPRNAGLGEDGSSKVHVGGEDHSRHELSPDILEEMQNKWDTVMTPVTGYKTYEELRAGINKELNRPF